jgi:hypothetical protein
MRYDSQQFGAFDGLDNRKELMRLFGKLGEGLSEEQGCSRRQRFLQGLLKTAPKFGQKPFEVSPCTAVEAYHLFVAITGVLGVPIDEAAQQLERAVRSP